MTAYEVIEELSSNDWFELKRARRRQDDEPVLLKVARRHPLRGSDVERFKREFDLLRSLSIPGIPEPREFVSDANDCFLVLKARLGRSLKNQLAIGRLTVDTFFKLAIPLCVSLGDLHRRDLICKSLSSQSVLVDTTSGQLTITDLSLASSGSAESPFPLPLYSMRSLLPYVSPEQTGRMNRTVDYRTDFYSLGIIFYEMLTGVLPFSSDDPLALIHAHIAKVPQAPSEVDRSIPEPLSQIVMKLLAKTAEERYQSALGITQDLECCEREWAAQKFIPLFPLAQRDVSDRFIIPAKLYGRDQETRTLLEAFDSVCQGGSAMLLVAGYSGIGKTSLIQELYKPIVSQKGYFISGKFDQVVRNIPFGALIQAFRGLVQQLLTESPDRLAVWRARLAQALGANGGVLAEVIPEIELILGHQPPPPALGPTEALNRFQLMFQNFVGVLARRDHPLVVFLDDLQWADSATLSLLQPLLTSSEVQFFFLIGAYRDNEVDAAHPLVRTLGTLEPTKAQVHRVLLGPLELSHLITFVADVLHSEPAEAEPLARLVLEKTGGNPFFVIQFLKALKQEGFLEFVYEQGCWMYRIEAIRHAAMTDNVIDLMTNKIHRLPTKSQHALTLAACIGNLFDLKTLAVVSEQPPETAAEDLKEAVEEGLVLSVTPRYEAFAEPTTEPPTSTAPSYAFLHDRVQQAAYALIPDERKQLVHLTVGRLLLERTDAASVDDKIFDLVQHLNLGSSLIVDDRERLSLARLNLSAGRKAKSSTAYEAALTYLKAGLGALTEECWGSEYDLTFALHIEAAECEYLCGHFEEAERRFGLLLERARTRLDKAQVYALRVLEYENLSRYTAAVEAGREGLALFGVSFPNTPQDKEAGLGNELSSIHALLDGRTIESLSDLPAMIDPEKRMVMKLLTIMWASAYISGDQVLTRLISATMVRLSLEHGNTEESAYGYATHTVTVGPIKGDYESAYAWGELALRVNERFNDRKGRAKIHQQFHAHANYWRRPFQTCVPHAREAARSGLETGDFAYAGYGAFTECWHTLLVTPHLDRFVHDCSLSLALLEKVKMTGLIPAQRSIQNWARALQGRTSGPTSFSDATFDEDAFVQTYGNHPFRVIYLYILKVHLCVLFEEFEQAQRTLSRARDMAHNLMGTIWPVFLDFFQGLTLTAVWRQTSESDRPALVAEIERIRESLSLLAKNCPENFGCAALLITAGLQDIASRISEAMTAFEDAIRYARETKNLHNEALACELYSRFWKQHGHVQVALLYLRRAQQRYSEWGATAKVRHLENQEFDLVTQELALEPTLPHVDAQIGHMPETTGPGISLDIATVTKAAHAIAGEIELEKLLRKLLKIAIENAGAQKGFFLEEKDARLHIAAEANVDREEVNVDLAVPLDTTSSLSEAVVHYVHKTEESIVIADALSDDRFSGDPYIAAARPKSILCVPIVHQGRLGGILYFENNLAANAFTADRIEVMRILSSQAAISLENARLYAGMKEEVARRRQAEDSLTAALTEVETLKNRLHAENVYLQEEIRHEHNFGEIVGTSEPLLQLLRQVEQVAPTDSTVLVYGETGTGKELIARAIHSRSRRRERPLVKVNCGAISAGLVESELFGHVKGAFTGAIENRSGRFELADGGTLFLDEVSELPLETQVKLLRVLQEQEFEPVGSSRTVRVDVRVIAASNRDLSDSVSAGRFRPDLFYRLNVFPLVVPPLRIRKSDIPQLVMFFISRFSKKIGKKVDTVSRDTMDRLVRYSWPGNIRELQNIIERGIVLATGTVLVLDGNLFPTLSSDEHLAASASAEGIRVNSLAPNGGEAARRAGERDNSISSQLQEPPSLEEVERRHILTVLEKTGWLIEGQKGAARILNLHPNTLRSRMKRLGIQR